MNSKNQLKENFINQFDDLIKEYDFKMTNNLSEFVQKKEFGWNKFQLIFLERDYGWEINPAVLVRFNEVENIYHVISHFEKKYQKNTPTIGTTLEDYFSNESHLRFNVNNLKDAVDESMRLFNLFEKTAIPFFREFNDLETVDRILNNSLLATQLTGPIFKGIKTLIIAKILNRNNFEEIEKEFESYYSSFSNGYYLEEYHRLKKYLKDLF